MNGVAQLLIVSYLYIQSYPMGMDQSYPMGIADFISNGYGPKLKVEHNGQRRFHIQWAWIKVWMRNRDKLRPLETSSDLAPSRRKWLSGISRGIASGRNVEKSFRRVNNLPFMVELFFLVAGTFSINVKMDFVKMHLACSKILEVIWLYRNNHSNLLI